MRLPVVGSWDPEAVVAATASIAALTDWWRTRGTAEPIPIGVRLHGESKAIEPVVIDHLQAGPTVAWTDVAKAPDMARAAVVTVGNRRAPRPSR